jgi:hypothetical protein
MSGRRFRSQECAYCGAPATSRDHVPPKNLFPGIKLNLITVPACERHNNERAGLDEQFREIVSLAVGVLTDEQRALWAQSLKALNRASSRKARIIESARPVLGTDQTAVLLDGTVISEMAERLVRGLYWHHFQSRLSDNVQIRTVMMNLEDVGELANGLDIVVVADGQFAYAYGRFPGDLTISMWVMLFHNGLALFSTTGFDKVDGLT